MSSTQGGKWWDDAKVRPAPRVAPQPRVQPPPPPPPAAAPTPPPPSAYSQPGTPPSLSAPHGSREDVTTNGLAIVALVLAVIGGIGGVFLFVHYLTSQTARILAAALGDHVGPLIGVIFMCGVAATLGAVANRQISRSAGRQTGRAAVTFAYVLSTGGAAAAIATFAVVGSAS